MKIKIYQEKETEEKELRLSLKKYEGGGVVLIAVDELGETLPCGNILEIREINGDIKLHLRKGVSETIGLSLDADQKIQIGYAI